MLVVNQVFKWFSDLARLRGAIPEEEEQSRAELCCGSQLKVFAKGDAKHIWV